MNIKALVTMLVLGSSSVAMARPVAVSGSAGASVVVRDHRTQAPAPAPKPAYQAEYGGAHRSPPWRPVWVNLGTESRYMDGEMKFHVSPYHKAKAFSTLKLQSSSGKSLIYRVKIQFANGRTQVVELNRYLNKNTPTITIDLAGDSARSIRNVTVIGRNATQSTYSVLAI